MIRALILCGLLFGPAAVAAQEFEFGAPCGPTPEPRAATILAESTGYELFCPERNGTPVQPIADEMGLNLVTRMFRTVCLGLEAGEAPRDLLPKGFTAYDQTSYLFAEPKPPESGGSVVLSPTGDIDLDEAAGHPTIWLSPAAWGATCKIEWTMAEPPPQDRQLAMAAYVETWLPYEFALIRANRPNLGDIGTLPDLHEWDRPCGYVWCPMKALSAFADGKFSLETALYIIPPEGASE